MHKYNKKKNDDWFSTKIIWSLIAPYLPKDKILWEAFWGDGTSAKHLQSLGFNVISEDVDFFKAEHLMEKCDMIVSNPHFSKKYLILKHLVDKGKPFVLILPLHCINAHKIRKIFGKTIKDITIFIPTGRLKFE